MKKVLIGISLVLAIMSCKSQNDNKKSDTLSLNKQKVIETSLNGYLEGNAVSMVQYFISTTDDKPSNTQIWFSKPIIDSICELLKKDSSGAVMPDGIRVYFGRTIPTTSDPIHFNNKIIIVSTYLSGTNSNGIDIHTDYFEHLSSAGLFKMGNINGEISHDVDDSNGALLYRTCVGCKDCPLLTAHDIPRSKAEKMVQAFYGKPFNPANEKAEWFDMKMLQALKRELKKEKDDGVRIYFARRVDTIGDMGKAVLLLTTTHDSIADGKHYHRDYFNCPVNTKGNSHDNGELCPSNCDGVKLP